MRLIAAGVVMAGALIAAASVDLNQGTDLDLGSYT
jgi:hypothetical protein